MKHEVLQNIQNTAKQDFTSIQNSINTQQDKVTASIQDIRFTAKDDVVTATCCFDFDTEVIEAAIHYGCDAEGVYADAEVNDVASAVLGALQPIMAADGDEEVEEDVIEDDAFDFEDEADPEMTEDIATLEEGVEMEDPESEPNIEADNNIAGHYIVECDRCQGIFISALMESDQIVDHINGVCPLCEKESNQYIKWVVKPVEF